MPDRFGLIQGVAATAQEIPLTNLHGAQLATLRAYLVHAPGQSPAWSHYLVGAIHLRPIPGERDANIIVPGATHELLVAALDPEPGPTIEDPETLRPLLPLNAQVQFIGTDAQAIAICLGATRAICAGSMPAEPPFQQQGQAAWEALVANTLEHWRTGVHAGP